MIPSINAVLSGNATKQDGVLFLELHGTILGLREMHGHLAKMRAFGFIQYSVLYLYLGERAHGVGVRVGRCGVRIRRWSVVRACASG